MAPSNPGVWDILFLNVPEYTVYTILNLKSIIFHEDLKIKILEMWEYRRSLVNLLTW